MTALADPVASLATTPAGGVHERVVAATLTCIARHGLNKTTLDDVAREAGCSRATIYRYFSGKAELVATVVRLEASRVTDTIRLAAEDADSLEDAVVSMLECAGHELSDHPALRFVADFEPERLLPHLTFAGGTRFLRRVADAIAPSLERFVPGRSARVAEWIARVGLTLWLCPNGPVTLSDPASLRTYVRAFVVPAIERTSSDPTPVVSAKR